MRFIRDIIAGRTKSKPVEPVNGPALEDLPTFASVIGVGDALPQADAGAMPPMPRTARIKVVGGTSEGEPEAVTRKNPYANDDAIVPRRVMKAADEVARPVVNIWDIEDENDTVEAQAPVVPSSRRRRNQTRVLGFDSAAHDVVSVFNEAKKTAPVGQIQFPVGWMVVAEGPGRGACFALEAGMSQIGRGEDQAVQLDFGDSSISRNNHAAVVYDPDTHTFTLGHGGKKNIVRLNGKPLISNEKLTTGDKVTIGETVLHFVPLCSEEFNWSDKPEAEESEHVAIA